VNHIQNGNYDVNVFYVGLCTTNNGIRVGISQDADEFGRIVHGPCSEAEASNFIVGFSMKTGHTQMDNNIDTFMDSEVALDYVGLCETDKGLRVGISEATSDFTHMIEGPLTNSDAVSLCLSINRERGIPVYSDEEWLTGN
jgi:hypothetical protein